MPKLTWSCPKDAIWITTLQTMKCSHSDEVMMLLKCSDRIAHDLSIDEKKTAEEEEGQHHQRHVLALRQWKDINPVGEFRCFVSNHKLIGTLYTVYHTPSPHLLPSFSRLHTHPMYLHRYFPKRSDRALPLSH
jgi:hypothetical protein